MSSAIENTPNDNDTDNPKDPSSNKSIAALSKKNSSITIVPRPAKTFPTNYESLDYDPLESQLEIEKEQKEDFFIFDVKTATRWTLALLIGVFTALIAFVCDVIIEELSDIKFEILEQSIENSLKEGKTYILLAYVYTVLSNIFFVAIGSLLVTYVEPVAGGSGIPQVKCYLNGVKVPHVLRCRTLFVKVAGVITSVVGGLAGGMEGPMIHAGAVVGGTISQSRNTKLVKDFRMDAEKRDFVSIGAASGVAAAFGAPIGGVLFSLEEGTSFWNQSLIWKTFFGTAMATLTLNLGLSLYMGHFGTLSHPGLISFGKVDAFPFEIYEMPIFVIFGMVGGLLGALWNQLNYKLAVFRKKHGKVKWHRVTEACVVAAGTATIGYLMMFGLDACIPIGNDSTKESLKFACKEGEYNSMAAVWLKTPKQAIRSMLHDPPHSQNKVTLAFFVVGYFLVSTITFGLSMSIGLFLPNLLTGAAWGRLLGSLITSLAPPGAMKPAKYALIGAAAQLGGVVRMTISLTVIIMEATGQIFEEIPIMITLLVAKWTGDYFNESIYELHIKLAGIPYIEWEPPPRSTSVYASHIMSHPALCVSTREKASIVMDLLHKYSYNGFPVVKPLLLKNDEDDENNDPPRYRKLRGLILRSQLVVLLQKKMFNEYRHWNTSNLDVNLFSDAYPVYPTVDEVTLTDEELNYTLDLQPFMNPTPYTVPHNASLPRLFRLFRALGLRHLPIVNQDYEVVGMVTRKDIAFLEE